MNWLNIFSNRAYLQSRKAAEMSRAPRPPAGATICCAGLRMTMQAGVSRDLWRWLRAQGWGPLPEGASRYKLKALSSTVMMRLIDAEEGQWETILNAGIRQATQPDAAPATLSDTELA